LRLLKVIALVLLAVPMIGLAASPNLWLFESSYHRAVAGQARQKARLKVARQQEARAARLFNRNVLSAEEMEEAETTSKLAQIDLFIAELKTRQASLSLKLAKALDRNAKRIPLCVRKKQKDEDTVSDRLRRAPLPPFPTPRLDQPGTKVLVDDRLENSRDVQVEPPPVKVAETESPRSPFPSVEAPGPEVDPGDGPGGNLPAGPANHTGGAGLPAAGVSAPKGATSVQPGKKTPNPGKPAPSKKGN